MRTFNNMIEAAKEVRRDLYKSPLIWTTRVQQEMGLDLQGHERLGYSYAVPFSGLPTNPNDLVDQAIDLGFEFFKTYESEMRNWIRMEEYHRYHTPNPATFQANNPPAETVHPALRKTIEGNTWSYVYRERLYGLVEQATAQLAAVPDSRRVFIPIYQPMDLIRAGQPTRVPCTLGYQLIIRDVPGHGKRLNVVYLQRSSDFERFWLTDLYFAARLLEVVANQLEDVEPGLVMHYIISFHDFVSGDEEIY